MLGDVKKISALWTSEALTLNQLPPERDKPHVIDVFELFAGSAKATMMAKDFKLNALELLLLLGFPRTLFLLYHERELQLL